MMAPIFVRRCRRSLTIASRSAIVALLAFTPAVAQGKGAPKKPPKAQPPAKSVLPQPTVINNGGGSTPLSWLDDANLLEPGAASVAVSTSSWHGSDASQLDAPVVNVAVGVAKAFQLSMVVPHTMGDETVSGGLGTTWVSGKIGVHADAHHAWKLAIIPTVQLLSADAAASLGPNANRLRWGIPVSAEFDRGRARFFASAGYFQTSVWFAGIGFSYQTTPRAVVSGSYSHAWSTDETLAAASPTGSADRSELSGSAAYTLTRHVAAFGSLGHTIATADANGAGWSMGAGISVAINPTTIVIK